MFVDKFLEKYLNPLWAMIGTEVLGVVLLMMGVLPIEAALFFVGIFAFFVLFVPLKQAVLFTVFSIPLYTALPIFESFDTMASWRIIILILFLRVLWGFLSGRLYQGILQLLKARLGILVSLFFLIGILSLLVAQEPIIGIKKLLYLANAAALFFIVYEVIKNKKDFIDVLRYAFAGSVLALAVGYAQFIAVLFVPLYSFWQWWAQNVIPVFYGADLGNLLSYSNTWFSYYENAEPTLRIFSLFPDSHSFALSMILTLPMTMTFFVLYKGKGKFLMFFGGITILILLAIIFSGTRGAWVGAAPVFAILIMFYVLGRGLGKRLPELSGLAAGSLIKLYNKGGSSGSLFPNPRPQFQSVIKISILSFLIFALLFPISSQFLRFSQSRQGGKVSDDTTFERISTSFSTRELSNKGRIQIWKSTFGSIAEHPFLGVGIGNYPVVLEENVSATKKGVSAHSLYLDVISEMGILGGILLLFIFFEILRRALVVFVKSRDSMFIAFGGFFAVYFLWMISYSVVDVVLLNDKVLLLFVTLVGLLYTVPKIEKVT